ncbi:MAG: polyphenol oxidase family protein [Bacteriovorax sp.]|nr:polyphenol oxidase family protein [Bacteriovorax sp.]
MPNPVFVLDKLLPRGRFCVYQSRPGFDLIRVKQTHSAIVLNEKNCNELEADGMIGASSTPMAILTADCLPILLLGEKEHAFVHAGWRGLHNEILKNELIKKIDPFYAFIGPHISVLHYEVQPDFKENFDQSEAFIEREGKLFFNLSVVAQAQLKASYPGISIEESGLCTYSNENFHSYRRNKTTERNWNVYIP